MSLVAETKYLARSTLVLDPSSSDSVSSAAGRDLQDANVIEAFVATQLKILEDRSTLDDAAKLVGRDPEDLKDVVTISRVGATTVINVDAVSADREFAVMVSDAVGQAFAESRKETALVGLRRALAEINNKLGSLRDELTRISNDSDASAAELRAVESQYAQLFNNAQELEIELSLKQSGVEFLSAARLESDPVSPRPIRNSITLFMLGGLIGVATAAVRHQFDTKLRTDEQMEEITQLPVLASLPTDSTIALSSLPVVDHPFSQFVEGLRSLRTSIEFLSMSEPIKVLLVTGSTPGEGKSTVAIGLACTQAQSGQRVLLISADLRRPTAERILEEGNQGQGLSDLIALTSRTAQYRDPEQVDHARDLARVVRPTRLEGLSVLTSGTVPPNPNELLSSAAMRRIIATARAEYDFVLIDTPPLAIVADALVLARDVDAVMLVASLGLTRREAIRSAARQMRMAGVRTIGIASNLRPAAASTYYGYAPADETPSPRLRPSGRRGHKPPVERQPSPPVDVFRDEVLFDSDSGRAGDGPPTPPESEGYKKVVEFFEQLGLDDDVEQRVGSSRTPAEPAIKAPAAAKRDLRRSETSATSTKPTPRGSGSTARRGGRGGDPTI